MKSGIELIADERNRQINAEGWTPEHDDQHTHCELAQAACAYAGFTTMQSKEASMSIAISWWPDEWDWNGFKPKDRLSNLIRAGALIAAEIDRLQRIEQTDAPHGAGR